MVYLGFSLVNLLLENYHRMFSPKSDLSSGGSTEIAPPPPPPKKETLISDLALPEVR